MSLSVSNLDMIFENCGSTCFSGGAYGSDTQFGLVAQSANHDVIHMSFIGHSYNHGIDQRTVLRLPQDLLNLADGDLAKAAPFLRKRYSPNSPYIANLLRRNWYQIRWSNSLYAVSTIHSGVVQGGTGWAVEMFINKHHRNPCDCFVFDQNTNMWYKWNAQWDHVGSIPTPNGKWTGIGTRKLNSNGMNAIKTIFDDFKIT